MEKEGTVSRLKEWFKNQGITVVLFDMDGTLVDTSAHYVSRMSEYCRFVASKSGRLESELFNMFMGGVVALRDEFSVRSAVLDVPARVIAKMCGVGGVELEEELEKLMKIYELPPVVLPGAIEQVKLIRDAGVRVVLVTHAGEEWTQRKLSQGFLELFDGVVCTPVHLPKDIEAWENAMIKEDVDPRQALVVGDNPVSDIESALGAGVKMTALVGGKEPVCRQREIVEIETIADLAESLLNN